MTLLIIFNLEKKKGTGFKFWEPTPTALFHTIMFALEIFYEEKELFSQILQRAMREDFSWEKSARAYENLYLRTFF